MILAMSSVFCDILVQTNPVQWVWSFYLNSWVYFRAILYNIRLKYQILQYIDNLVYFQGQIQSLGQNHIFTVNKNILNLRALTSKSSLVHHPNTIKVTLYSFILGSSIIIRWAIFFSNYKYKHCSLDWVTIFWDLEKYIH